MSSCGSEPDDYETGCETSISESCVHNRYYTDGLLEFDDDPATEYVSLGRMTFLEWEKCEKRRLEMLNEANEKATQMEKTMTWWTECTALWRERWKIVRSERNSARNTIDQLMSNLHEVQNDTLKYFEAKVEAEQEIQRLRAKVQALESRLSNEDLCKDEELCVQEIV